MEIAVAGLTIAPVTILIAGLGFVVNLFFAMGVSAHAKVRSGRENTWFVGRLIWFVATLLGGVPVAAIYWVMHCSTLKPPTTTDE